MENFWGTIIILFLIILFVSIEFGIYNDGFKRGQIKALQGKFQYKLIEQQNGEMKYQKVEEYDLLKLEE